MKNLPVGTHIVTTQDKKTPVGFVKKGSVGEVREHLNDGTFLVKLPDNRQIVFTEEEISSRRVTMRGEFSVFSLTYEQIQPFVEFEFIAGSTAYGLTTPDSDQDVVGCYILPPRGFFALKPYQDTVVVSKPDGSYHEVKKLVALACKANPNVLEIGEISKIPSLVRKAPSNPLIAELLSRWQELFLTKYVFLAYQGYAMDQFKKIEKDLANHGEIRWKHACHLLRLLWCAIQCMQRHHVVLRPIDYDRDVHERLMSVKRGEFSLEQIINWRLQLEKDFQEAFDNCSLPEAVNEAEVNKLLVEIRLSTQDRSI